MNLFIWILVNIFLIEKVSCRILLGIINKERNSIYQIEKGRKKYYLFIWKNKNF